jgi:hypothetical protein
MRIFLQRNGLMGRGVAHPIQSLGLGGSRPRDPNAWRMCSRSPKEPQTSAGSKQRSPKTWQNSRGRVDIRPTGDPLGAVRGVVLSDPGPHLHEIQVSEG